MDEDLKARYKELERRRARRLISDDQYWEEIFILDRTADAAAKGIGAEESLEAVKGVGAKLLLYFLAISVVASLAYVALFYYPAPEGVELDVTGRGIIPASRSEKESVYKAIEIIKTYSPKDYALLTSYVNRIEVAGPAAFGIFGGRNVGSYTPAWGGKTVRLTRGFDCPAYCEDGELTGLELFLASILIHEACHSMQYNNGLDFSEPQCYGMQFGFVREVGPKIWEGFKEEFFVYEHPAVGFDF